VGAPVVVVPHVAGEGVGAACRGDIGAAIGPLAQQRLDKAFGFAIGPRRIGPGPFVPELPSATRLRKDLGAIATAVVRQNPLDPDPASSKPVERPPEEGRADVAPLRRADFDIREARGVIDRDVGVLPPVTRMATLAIAVNPVAHPVDAGKRLDIQMQ